MARRRRYSSRRSYRPVRSAPRRRSYGRTTRRRRTTGGGRTVRIVIEQPGASSLGRFAPLNSNAPGALAGPGPGPKAAKF